MWILYSLLSLSLSLWLCEVPKQWSGIWTDVTGLAPNATYFNVCGYHSLLALSEEKQFTIFLHLNFAIYQYGYYISLTHTLSLSLSQLCEVPKQWNGIWTDVTGLAPNTTYFYVCGDHSLRALSEEKQFTTFPQPGAVAADNDYPSRIAFVGDLGLTFNSSTTFDHIQRNNPSLLLLVGDLSYANNYITTGVRGAQCYSCAFPDTPIHETYQPHWDAWGRYCNFQPC